MKYDTVKKHEWFIRSAVMNDLNTLSLFMQNILTESSFLITTPDEWDEPGFKRQLKEAQKGETSFILTASHPVSGEIAGILHLRGNGRKKICHKASIGISVQKKYWGMGVGTQLIDSMLNRVRREGHISKINLTVRGDNARAIGLYGKKGFVVEGHELNGIYDKGVFFHILHMGLIVNSL